jgi:hypothetical protein
MSPLAWIAGAFGAYDPETAMQLEAGDQRRLLLVGLSCLVPCVTAAAGVGYAADLVVGTLSSDAVVAVACAALAMLAVGSLLRITMAGSGIAPQVKPEHAARWRPKHWPAAYLTLVGCILAQPLVVFLMSSWLDVEIDLMRGRIVAMHEAALHSSAEEREAELAEGAAEVQRRLRGAEARLERERATLASRNGPAGASGGHVMVEGMGDVESLQGELAEITVALQSAGDAATVQADEVAAYRRTLDSCSFLAERTRLAWTRPLVPAMVTLLTGLLTGLPLLLRQRFLGPYARAQHRAQRDAVARQSALVDRLANEAYRKLVLGADGKPRRACPSYTGPARARFADAPFNTEPLDFFGARVGAPAPSVAAVDEAIDGLLSSLPE